MNGTHPNIGLYMANQNVNNASRHSPDGVFDDMREAIDGTPVAAAVIGAGAILLLIFLKRVGFRFAVGVNVGR